MNILITGAGRGLGVELVKLAAERGHSVIACVRETTEISESLAAASTQFPGLIRIERLEVTSEADAAALADKLRSESLKLDGIVNNAAILQGRELKIESLALQMMKESFDVNVVGAINVAKHMVPLISEQSGAVVMNVSSESGSFSRAYGGDYPYAISKAALNYFSKQLGSELRGRGIRVLAVHPGWMRTDMGGDQAPLNASESAGGMLDLLEGRTAVGENVFFVDYTGRELAI
jgi:NAD(P)-dependent dehydrogenase (short-subunit alcohol dehydrogenase family)